MINLDKELELRVMAMTSVYNSIISADTVKPHGGYEDYSVKYGNRIVDEAIKKALRVEDV